MVTDIQSTATLVVGPYQDYYGRAEYDADADLFHGEVIGTRDVITFQGKSVAAAKKAFRDSVDDYLDFCKTRHERPDKPMSGKFIVRVSPEIHRKLVALAQATDVSLNQFIADVLSKASAEFDEGIPPVLKMPRQGSASETTAMKSRPTAARKLKKVR